MTVTKIEAIGRTKWKVELAESSPLCYTKANSNVLVFKKEAELSEELYEKIRKEVIFETGEASGDASFDRYGKNGKESA